MLSDEEKQAIEELKNKKADYFMISNLMSKTLLNLIEKQSKEIEELSDKLTEKICKGVEEEILEEYRQTIISKDKEIEELKEIKFENERTIELFIEGYKRIYKEFNIKSLVMNENILINEIKKNFTSNDKIKAKIEELENEHTGCTTNVFSVLQSLLEKEE